MLVQSSTRITVVDSSGDAVGKGGPQCFTQTVCGLRSLLPAQRDLAVQSQRDLIFAVPMLTGPEVS